MSNEYQSVHVHHKHHDGLSHLVLTNAHAVSFAFAEEAKDPSRADIHTWIWVRLNSILPLIQISNSGNRVVVISMVRIIYIYHWISNADFTYYQAAACIFSAAELNGGVICACSALLKPFLEQYFPRILALSSSGSRDESEGRRKKIFKKIKFGQDRQKQVGNPEAAEERVGAVGENHIAKASTVNVQGIKTERDVGESTEDLWAGSKD